MMKHPFRGAMLLAAGLALLWGGMALAGPTDADKCYADKIKRAGWYSFCRMKAESKGVKKSEAPDFTKCDDKITEKFGKAETKWGAECPTLGDVEDIKDQVTECTDSLVLGLSGGTTARVIDNGDGTVTDTQTGLMWEKKTDDSSIHDKDNLYDWYTAMGDWISEVNGWSADGSAQSGLGGHTDWRMPTSAELQTILLEPYPCGTNPCIDPIFGPTQSTYYWSSTTNSQYGLYYAWLVDFFYGFVNSGGKGGTNHYVRAVRGGLF